MARRISGLDPAIFKHDNSAGGTDQLAARAMNQALWPATIGYWMETMMSPVFSARGHRADARFFQSLRDCRRRDVRPSASARSPTASCRDHDYLAHGLVSQREVADHERRLGDPSAATTCDRLYPILLAIEQDFRAALGRDVSFVGKDGDPHALLLDIVGLHPARSNGRSAMPKA